LAENSSFGFLALACVLAKTKCAVCVAGFLIGHNASVGYVLILLIKIKVIIFAKAAVYY